MRTFLAILLVTTLALLASSTLGFRLRRSRLTAVLFGGGWIAIGVGAAIGPRGLAAVTLETIRSVTPLVVLGLGWIGLMIGLQAQRNILLKLPQPILRLAILDAILTLAIFGAAAWFAVHTWSGVTLADRWTLAALVACASLGWTMETRSLATGDDPASIGPLAVRGAGGLASIVTVLVFGTIYSFTHNALGATLTPAALGAARLVIAVALGLAAGLIGRFALREAASSRGASLTVILGIVALVGGLAFEMDLSPLFVAVVTGAVMANLAGNELRSFERVILRAEHAVAAIFAMLAGALLDPAIGWTGVGLAALIAGLRLVIKPLALRATPTLRDDLGALSWAVVRQSPLAIALAVSLVAATASDVAAKLLTIIVLAGLFAELIPLAAAWAMRRSPMGTAVQRHTDPATEEDPDATETTP